MAKGGSRALAQIGLAHVKRRRVVLVNDDPRVELAEIGIGIRACRLAGMAVLSVCFVDQRSGACSEAYCQQARAPEKTPAMRGENFFDPFWNLTGGSWKFGGSRHAATSFPEAGFAGTDRAAAMTLAARLMAA